MSILEMTYVSYFFMFMAAVFGVAAVIMYFVLDIRRCWRIIRGRQAEVSGMVVSSPVLSGARRGKCGESTEKLGARETTPLSVCESTLLLASEETVALETMDLVQDITMMQGSCVNP